ncbi:MAG: aminotransferase class I/II-fold pyridoxal phosphate-dependent enzyme [Elusimicrobia bacterium]|nr:aminotransferase class I/II-fold pyridoxal phosphate-dependent enzyme [Elusimicrobiota bacterium]
MSVPVCPIRERFRKRAESFCRALHAAGWHFPDPQGSCFVWARPPVKCASLDAVLFMLEKASILTAPGSGFGKCGEGYVRFSLTEPDAKLAEAARRIKALDWRTIK